jgi:hypothetical protein
VVSMPADGQLDTPPPRRRRAHVQHARARKS